MRRTLAGVVLAVVGLACTEPGESLTEILTPSPGASASTAGPRITEIVGDSISVETPFANGDVGPPVSVTGTADVAGGDVTIRVLDDAGGELAQTIVEASCGDGCTGTFAAELFYFVREETSGWIEVTGASAEGPTPRVRVPVTLFP